MLKILLTGASGFIGQNLLKKLIHENCRVTCLQRNSSSFSNLNSTVVKYKKINDIPNIISPNSFDGIIHLATHYVKDYTPEDISQMIESNILFPSKIIESIGTNSQTWFLNTGTIWQNRLPQNFYAYTKGVFEKILDKHQTIASAHFLLSDTFGSNDHRPKLFNFWKKHLGSDIFFKMDYNVSKFLIHHIDDVIEGYWQLMLSLQKKDIRTSNNKFLINYKTNYSLMDLANIIETITKKRLPLIWPKNIDIIINNENHIAYPSIPNWNEKTGLLKGLEKFFL